MSVRVTIYPDVVQAEARRLSTPERVDIARDIAAEGAARAPVDTGSYKSAFDVVQSGDRVSAVNTDPAASYITLGTVDTPPHMGFIDAARKRGRYTAQP
ncbi:MAG: HK97 gp10 family phage protein [Actinomycetota bacterium]|nr:HK97 gp10 family phage protein [Actinomycetota bacterium]